MSSYQQFSNHSGIIYQNKQVLLIILILFIANNAFNQDIHFTQYFNAPIYQNPAQCGIFNGKYRAIINNKTQWKSITIPFKTMSFSLDSKIIKPIYKKYILSTAISVNRDITGDSKLSILNVFTVASLVKPINKRNNQVISIGIQPIFRQCSIDFSQLQFDNQYHNGVYNSSANNGEQFSLTNYNNFDFTSGLLWKNYVNSLFEISLGFSVSHLLQPKETFLGNINNRLDRKFILHGESNIALSNLWKLEPTLQFSKQHNYYEMLGGFYVTYSLGKNVLVPYSVSFGNYYRLNDAIISYTGLQYSNVKIGISYDINTSKLKTASNYKGGFEFSIIYIFGQEKKIFYQVPCKIF